MYIVEYIFVACLREFGSVTLRDEKGNAWNVSTTGSWIPDIFPRNERQLFFEKERYCFRSRSVIKQKPIYLISPSFDDMEKIPTGG